MSQRKKLKVILSDEATVGVAEAVRAAVAELKPDPEVRAVAKRRQFSAAYKLTVLAEADRANEPGAVGALLRRGGIAGGLIFLSLRGTSLETAEHEFRRHVSSLFVEHPCWHSRQSVSVVPTLRGTSFLSWRIAIARAKE